MWRVPQSISSSTQFNALRLVNACPHVALPKSMENFPVSRAFTRGQFCLVVVVVPFVNARPATDGVERFSWRSPSRLFLSLSFSVTRGITRLWHIRSHECDGRDGPLDSFSRRRVPRLVACQRIFFAQSSRGTINLIRRRLRERLLNSPGTRWVRCCSSSPRSSRECRRSVSSRRAPFSPFLFCHSHLVRDV